MRWGLGKGVRRAKVRVTKSDLASAVARLRHALAISNGWYKQTQCGYFVSVLNNPRRLQHQLGGGEEVGQGKDHARSKGPSDGIEGCLDPHGMVGNLHRWVGDVLVAK